MVSATIRSELLKHIAEVEEEVSLERFNALGVGGVTDYFTVVHDTIELASAVRAAIDLHLPYLVIGAGEGLLFSDGGFPGIVIQNAATSQVLAADHSQMIVDSGLLLQRFITTAASQGFGGLTNLYKIGGTIGAGIYQNIQADGQRLLDSVRFVTMLVPPSRMKVESTIVRYKSDWLLKDGGGITRLKQQRQSKPVEEPYPVILNAHIQLTSVRSDEVIRRIQHQAHVVERELPKAPAFGPIFNEIPGQDLAKLLQTKGLERIRYEGIQVDRRHPNFLRRGKNRPTAAQVWQACQDMQTLIQATHGVELSFAFERIGVW